MSEWKDMVKNRSTDPVKGVNFRGSTLDAFRDMPKEARQGAGYKIDLVQRGEIPTDCDPISRVGVGAMELRVWSDDGTYRIIYVAKFKEVVHILHVFKKTTRAISKKDIDIAKKNYDSIRS